MTPVNNGVNVIIQVYNTSTLLTLACYWQSDTQCCSFSIQTLLQQAAIGHK